MSRFKGFTLIELLVVLVIVTIIVGLATLQLGGGGRANQIRWEFQHFADTLELASDEARLSGNNRGLALWRQDIDAPWRYSWFHQLQGQWVLADEELDRVFAGGQLSAQFEADLLIEDEAVLLPEDVKPDEPIDTPQIYFFSGGEITPFELTFWMERDNSQHYLIKADLLGRVQLLEPDHAG